MIHPARTGPELPGRPAAIGLSVRTQAMGSALLAARLAQPAASAFASPVPGPGCACCVPHLSVAQEFGLVPVTGRKRTGTDCQAAPRSSRE